MGSNSVSVQLNFLRQGAGLGLWLRLIFEIEVLRYLAALLPFLLGAILFPQYALAISQAPLPMLIVIYFVEAKVLRLSKPAARSLAKRPSMIGATLVT